MSSLMFEWKKWIHLGLEEDVAAFDWTARSVSSQQQAPKTAYLIAKSDGVWVGNEGLAAVELLSREMNSPLVVKALVQDGSKVVPKQKVASLTGPAQTILIFERTLINLAAYTSGIATQTQALVAAVESLKLKNTPRITPTRKTLPGYRNLAFQSVILGGGSPHRYNLSGGLLLKENHIAAAGGITQAISAAKKTAPHLLKIEIEVRNLAELSEAIQAGAEVIMLDNFSPALIKEAIKNKPAGTLFEVSGGMNSSNIREYALEGVDVISVGSITHSVKALDLSLLMSELT